VKRARLCAFAIFAPLREKKPAALMKVSRKDAKDRKDAKARKVKLWGNVMFPSNILAPTGFCASFLLKFG
jgi:hypothetical protein